MRLLILACLVCLAAADGDPMMQEAKKWMKMKALESCLGEDVVKGHLIKMKKAASKCTGMDAPELDIPAFKNPFRLVSTLVKGGRDQGQNLEQMMSMMLRMQMLSQFSDANGIQKRAADEDVYDLGERLQEKLKTKKVYWEAKKGNMTCMMQELGLLDAQEKFDVSVAKREWKSMGPSDKWLKDKLETGCDACEEFAKNVPNSLLDEMPCGREMGKVMFFKKCMMKTKICACMDYDIKNKLEKHFGSVDELTSSTGLEEKQLFMVVRELMKGPEEMMH